MKKILITITLLCVALTLHALDYRQVIFGNSYENIIEINADDFFSENLDLKEYYKDAWSKYEPPIYYRVYKQEVGKEIFYRVLKSDQKYSDNDLRDWKNVDFNQDFFHTKGKQLTRLYTDVDFYYQQGIEVIERNNTVIGILKFDRVSAFFTPWGRENIRAYRIDVSEALIDERRPFMYTIQNAFDGNPKTSYVEDTFDNMFSIQMRGNLQIREFALINGYADGDYYYQNNQVSKVALRVLEYYYDEFYENIAAVTLADTRLFQTIPVNMQFYDGETAPVLEVFDIKQGTKFTDTCMAEFDVYIEDRGWLFGGLEGKTLEAQKTTGAYQYRLLEDNTLEITKYLGSETDITIPREAEYSGTVYPVTSIGSRAFEKSNISTLIVPESVKTIGEYSFFRCEALEQVTLSEGLLTIEKGAFVCCYALKDVTIPKSVTTLSDDSFGGVCQ